MREPIALRTVILPGVLVGLLAVLSFGTVHAWLIVPIWSRLARGLGLSIGVVCIAAAAGATIAAIRSGVRQHV
jgi:hypothetical protein